MRHSKHVGGLVARNLTLPGLLLPLLWMGACTAAGPAGLAGGTTSTLDTGVNDPNLTLTPAIATVVDVGWSAPLGSATWVEYGLDSAFDLKTPSQVASDQPDSESILGLKAGHTYQVRVAWQAGDGSVQYSPVQDYAAPMYPNGVTQLTLDAAYPDDAEPGGFILLSLMQTDRDFVIMLDRDADVVWWYDVGLTVISPTVRMSRDGRSVLMGVYDRDQVVDIGEIRRVSLRTGEITSTRTELGHHDFLELPDGRLAWLAYDKREVIYGGVKADVVGDSVVIGEEGRVEGDPTQTLLSFHDLIHADVGCSHTTLQVMGLGGFDWSHGNSLAYVEDANQIVAVARHLDTIIAVDADSGERVWSLGGDQGLLGEGGKPMDHGHLSSVWSDGLLIFDNGDHRPDQHSRVIQYSYDLDAGTYHLEWEAWAPETVYVHILGDARLLPGGDRLVSWATLGRISEISDQGVEVWAVQSDVGTIFGRIKWIKDIYSPERGW